jgi:predicted AAA+ superfamily ATPase
MKESSLQFYNPWWGKDYDSPGIPRENYLDRVQSALDANKVAMLFGLRRVGKTTLLKQLVARATPDLGPTRVFYASMDHPDIRDASLTDLLNEFRRINRVRTDEPHLLILDEVQHRKGFELELKAIHDIEDGCRVVASGSSSLVVRHRSPAMTGRYRKIHVRPLSFEEFLRFRGGRFDASQPPLMVAMMEEYLLTGGMPEYVLTGDPENLIDVVDDIILKDIGTEYDVRDPALLKDLFFLIMDRVGRPMSFSRIGRLVNIGPDAARKYVGYFEETGLVHLVERDGTPNERKHSPRKCYCADTGIRVLATGNSGIGALAENMVFNILKGQNDIRYLLRDGREVDFRAGDALVEVKYKDDLSPEDLEGILGPRLRGVKTRYVITRGEVPPIKGVTAIPLWKLAQEDGLP